MSLASSNNPPVERIRTVDGGERRRQVSPAKHRQLPTSSSQFARNILERAIDFATKCRNRSQADDDDQGEHDGVLHRCGPIFRNEEMLYFLGETSHSFLRLSFCPPDIDVARVVADITDMKVLQRIPAGKALGSMMRILVLA